MDTRLIELYREFDSAVSAPPSHVQISFISACIPWGPALFMSWVGRVIAMPVRSLHKSGWVGGQRQILLSPRQLSPKGEQREGAPIDDPTAAWGCCLSIGACLNDSSVA